MKTNFKSDDYLNTFSAVEVTVTGRVEDAIHRFRALVTKERIMSSLKEHSRYEKPSEKRRRKHRESQARLRKAASLASRREPDGFYEEE